MEPLVVTLIVGLLATPLATIVAFLTGRRKYHAESQATIAEGATNAVEAISAVLDSLRDELDQTRLQLSDALEKLDELKEINEKLVRENRELREQVLKLTTMLEKKTGQ